MSRGKREFIDNLTTEHLIRLLEEREEVVVGWGLVVVADMWLKVHLLAEIRSRWIPTVATRPGHAGSGDVAAGFLSGRLAPVVLGEARGNVCSSRFERPLWRG